MWDRRIDGWMDGVVIIGHRPSKSTFGANKKEQIQIGLGLATALMILRFLCLLAVLHGLSSTKPIPSEKVLISVFLTLISAVARVYQLEEINSKREEIK